MLFGDLIKGRCLNGMNKLEFVNKIFFAFPQKEQKIIMQKAQKEGFIVEGFEKSPWLAPKSRLKNFFALENKKKHIYHHAFIFGVIKSLKTSDGVSKKLVEYSKKWKTSDDAARVEKEIANIIKNEEKISPSNQQNVVAHDEEVLRLTKKIKKTQEKMDTELAAKDKKIEQLKERNKNSESQRQKLKDDYGIEAQKLKENYDLKISKLNENLKELKNENIMLNEEKDELLKRIHELELLRPRVLCFGKERAKETMVRLLEKYKIRFCPVWDKEVLKSIRQEDYDIIWFIYCDLAYSSFVEIKEEFRNKKIEEFLSWDNVMERMG